MWDVKGERFNIGKLEINNISLSFSIPFHLSEGTLDSVCPWWVIIFGYSTEGALKGSLLLGQQGTRETLEISLLRRDRGIWKVPAQNIKSKIREFNILLPYTKAWGTLKHLILSFIHLRWKYAVNYNKSTFYMIYINPTTIMRYHSTGFWMNLT